MSHRSHPRSTSTFALAMLAVAGLAVIGTPLSAQPVKKTTVNPEITREGTGARREALTKLELEPFDATAWASVSKWSGDKAPAAADLSGQVVLICTWKHYHPVSKRGMEIARRLADQNAGKGLVVVAVHDSIGWDDAQKAAALAAAANKDIKFFVGYDEKGDFRKAISSDGDPDFYLIDRAGQLRYADIATESVEAAVGKLVGETAEAAAAIKGNLASEAEKARREAARSSAARGEIDMLSIPALPPGYTAPAGDAFSSLSWPKTIYQTIGEPPSDTQDKAAPSIQLPDGEGWIPSKPELQGRVWVVYFWALDNYHSYAIMQQMDQLQKARGRDVAVVGVLTKIAKDTNSSAEEKPEDPAKLLAKVGDFTRGKSLEHATYVDPSGGLLQASRGSDTSSTVIPLPYAVVCSSDGTVRFTGWAKHPSFESTLDNTIAMDPGVKARRAADAAYVKTKSK